ncbi:MAG TPA: HAD family hydrolase, partial [Bacillota bacterium]|nr:HAD family hydrolase [Bacillota bacterium]
NASRFAALQLGVPQQRFMTLCLQQLKQEGHSGTIFDKVLETLGQDKSALPGLISAFRYHPPKLSLYPDAQRFLSTLKGQAALGLVTDGLASVQRKKVEALKLKDYFSTIVYSDELGPHHWKPSTLPYLTALERLGASPADGGVYIGDNPHKDFAGAKQVGLFTVRLLRGPFRHQTVPPRLDANLSCRSFDSLGGVIF